MSEKASPYRDAFLFCVPQTGNLTMAAEFVGITCADVMADMRADPSFETDVQNAKEEEGSKCKNFWSCSKFNALGTAKDIITSLYRK